LAPAFRASESPIAIACFLLVTFLPDPLRNVPCLRSRMVFSTFDWAVDLRGMADLLFVDKKDASA